MLQGLLFYGISGYILEYDLGISDKKLYVKFGISDKFLFN